MRHQSAKVSNKTVELSPSPATGTPKSMSRTNMFVTTLPPASLQTLAAALSRAKPPPSQSPCPRICCAVMAKKIEWPATPADALGQRKGEMEAALEKHPEQS